MKSLKTEFSERWNKMTNSIAGFVPTYGGQVCKGERYEDHEREYYNPLHLKVPTFNRIDFLA